MKKLLVCQHAARENLGTLDPLLRQSGFRIRYVNFSREPTMQPTLQGYDGLVVLGGHMNIDEADRHPHLIFEQELLRDAMRRDIPVLGICLGAQLIAASLGSPVGRNPVKEIGWYEVTLTDEGRHDPVLQHFRPMENLFQWHGDTFQMPEGAVHLAVSATCRHQAFRYGDKVYGFQFHLEVDEHLIEYWLRKAETDGETKTVKINAEHVRRETIERIAHNKELAVKTFGEFIKLFGSHSPQARLASR